MEYERTHAAAIITEKRGKNFDKVMGEWKAKADDLMSELEACRCEGRNYSSEVFRLKAGYDETMEQLDVVKRENKVIPSHYIPFLISYMRSIRTISIIIHCAYCLYTFLCTNPYVDKNSFLSDISAHAFSFAFRETTIRFA